MLNSIKFNVIIPLYTSINMDNYEIIFDAIKLNLNISNIPRVGRNTLGRTGTGDCPRFQRKNDYCLLHREYRSSRCSYR